MMLVRILLAMFGLGVLPQLAWAACPPGTYQTGEERVRAGNTITVHPVCDYVPTATPPAWVQQVIATMLAYSRTAGWSPEERARLEASLNTLPLPALPPDSVVARMRAWDPLPARAQDATLIAAAARGQGPGLFSSGWQSPDGEDCALFALANAAGLPYGVVAARANELIRAADWRPDTMRSDPVQVFRSGGLVGGEVIILAEMFGQVDVIPPAAFEATLRAGRPVMVGVLAANASSHQVVLSRTFQHEGATWYEVINSTQEGPSQRTFIQSDELTAILQENGIAYRPDPGATAPLLRDQE